MTPHFTWADQYVAYISGLCVGLAVGVWGGVWLYRHIDIRRSNEHSQVRGSE